MNDNQREDEDALFAQNPLKAMWIKQCENGDKIEDILKLLGELDDE